MYTEGAWFKDEAGRTLILRGANVSGSSKWSNDIIWAKSIGSVLHF